MTQTTLNAVDSNGLTQSYGRCIANQAFLDRFYERFTTKSPVIADMFQNTDMAAQKKLLRSGISFLTQFARGSEFAGMKIDALGKSHSRSEINVDPSLYPLWVSALIETLAEFDTDWSPELEVAWRDAVQKGIDRIISQY